MKTNHLSRRQFLERSAGAAGALLLTSARGSSAQAAAKRTAVDQVALGKTGLKLSRLGFGTGSNSGNVQYALGQENVQQTHPLRLRPGHHLFRLRAELPHLRLDRAAPSRACRARSCSSSPKSPANPRRCSRPLTTTARSSTRITWTACSFIAWSKTAGPTTGSASWTPSTRPRRRSGSGPRASPATACPPCAPLPPPIGPRCTWCASTRKAPH